LSQGDITSQQLYLYYVGVYYQVVSPKFVVRDRLLLSLIDRAQKLDTDLPNPVDRSSPQVALGTILDEFAKRQFKKRIGYPYDGNQTDPDDLAPKKKVVGLSTMMYFASSPVTMQTITDKIMSSIVDQAILPFWIEEPLQMHLGRRIKSNTDEARLDSWNFNLYQRQYSNHREGVLPYNVRAVITYANGRAVEDGHEAIASMVHFLGIFYPTTDDVGKKKPTDVAAQVDKEVDEEVDEEYDNCTVKPL